MRLPRSHFTKQNGMNKNQYKHFRKPVETKNMQMRMYQFKLTKNFFHIRYFFHINNQQLCHHKKNSLCKLHIFSVVIIIWNLFIFRRELQLEVEQMYTTYWIVVTWRRDWGVIWHVGSSLLILVTTAMFVGLAPCESKSGIFLICYVTTWSICYMTLWVGPIHPVTTSSVQVTTLLSLGSICLEKVEI